VKAAAGGYPRAEAAMGIRYVMGIGVPKDNCRALDMFRKAYAQDPKLVANEMGNMYKDGLCVQRNLDLAKLYYSGSPAPEATVNQDNLTHASTDVAKAQIDRAVGLENQNRFTEAAVILKPLAAGGDRQAQEQLGYCYWRGGRTSEDLAQAVHWWQAAAEQQSGYAEAMLGDMYELGLGVPKDEHKAFALYRSSANKMNGAGYFYLARAYEFGIGAIKDRDAAIRYYTKAAQRGDDAGAHFAEFLKNPNNQDYRTGAEYQAAVKRDATIAARARANVSCMSIPMTLYRDSAGGTTTSSFSGQNASAGYRIVQSCVPR
jgi:uncharacterized protein